MKKRRSSKIVWKYHNLEHDPYFPVETIKDKFSSDILLKNSFFGSPFEKSFLLLISKIQKKIGPWNTVWRVQLEHGVVTWEFYFFKKIFGDSTRGVNGLLRVLRSYFKIPELFAEDTMDHQPWFVFSVNLSQGIFKSRKMPGVHISVKGTAGHAFTYYWDHKGYSFENQYDGSFSMPEDNDQLVKRIKQTLTLSKHCSSFLKHDLISALLPCKAISFGTKKNGQGFYFSGIKLDQFIFFLEYFSYPPHIIDFIRSNKEKLDHMLYDVAFDCILDPAKLVFSKSGFYGGF